MEGNKKLELPFFEPISKAEVLKKTSIREGETKLGQIIETEIKENMKGKIVIIGVPESIGCYANAFHAGSEHAFSAFLSYFLNIQQNKFFPENEVILAGNILVKDLIEKAKPLLKNTAELRKIVELMDERVSQILSRIFASGAIPIIIGGGHSNSQGIMKAYNIAFKKPISCLNIDSHADFRALEGRHSGNGFSQAKKHGQMDQYFVYGLHESYTNQKSLELMMENSCKFVTFEEILREENPFTKLKSAWTQFKSDVIGLELDLDSMPFTYVGSYSPTGFSIEEVRKMLWIASNERKIAYFQIVEGAPDPTEERSMIYVGKAISYFVTDIIKGICRS